ncbi:hypothetical protein HDU76_009574 [Blyttiomyces sp. JEL0837]|nr:hypothetical protein HDU76_009574 [Blyttiomyces sp. JEL0837]
MHVPLALIAAVAFAVAVAANAVNPAILHETSVTYTPTTFQTTPATYTPTVGTSTSTTPAGAVCTTPGMLHDLFSVEALQQRDGAAVCAAGGGNIKQAATTTTTTTTDRGTKWYRWSLEHCNELCGGDLTDSAINELVYPGTVERLIKPNCECANYDANFAERVRKRAEELLAEEALRFGHDNKAGI